MMSRRRTKSSIPPPAARCCSATSSKRRPTQVFHGRMQHICGGLGGRQNPSLGIEQQQGWDGLAATGLHAGMTSFLVRHPVRW
jgi:hypothetical protein